MHVLDRREKLEQAWLLGDRPVHRGNFVELLMDGAEYFDQWFAGVEAVMASGGPTRRILHSAWRLSDVARRGRLTRSDSVATHLARALAEGVDLRLMVSGHAWSLTALSPRLRVRLLRARDLQLLVDLTAPSIIASNHQKVTIFETDRETWALIGSVDLAPSRFERQHGPKDPTRYITPRGPSHDVGFKIYGSAAMALRDGLSAHWDDLVITQPGRRRVWRSRQVAALSAGHDAKPSDTQGSSLQLVYTVPHRANVATRPDDSLWRLYGRALSSANAYIYIEDQYFNPDLFDTVVGPPAPGRDRNLIDLLESALDRQTKVILMLPTPVRKRASRMDLLGRRRELAVSRLHAHRHAATHFIPLHYQLPMHSVYIHSKLLLCDDKFMVVGSANINRRGMLSDYEVGVGLVDELLVPHFRARLWSEHARRSPLTSLHSRLAPSRSPSADEQLRSLLAARHLGRYAPLRTARLGGLARTLIDRVWDPLPGG